MDEHANQSADNPLKRRPEGARQHATAGPYSPVLEIDAQRLVVISGQVAVDLHGGVIGDTIEEQTRATLGNCIACLASAGSTLRDVFKVNIYLTNLGDWARFNEVYQEIMPEPLPVRTTVQAVLLPGFLVEIEMWAVKARD
ncbi:MAG TPA: RidA family protein [Dongiaceae bacterium]|nr:RidA family protein [Dongiaceae bacterium]